MLKKYLKVLIITLYSSNIFAQAPTITSSKCFGGTSGEQANDMKKTSDGGYIVAGYSNSIDGDVTGNHNLSGDCWIAKFSSLGTLQWQKSIGGSGYDYANSILQTSDGGYIFTGLVSSIDGDAAGSSGTDDDVWVVKLNSSGVIQWQKTYGGTQADSGAKIIQTTDGGYLIAGNSQSNNGDVTGNHGSYDGWAFKIDSSGTLQWQKSYGGVSVDSFKDVVPASDGGYILAGSTASIGGDVSGHHGTAGYDDIWIVKINTTGTILWQKCLGGNSLENLGRIKPTSDGGYVLVGSASSTTGDVSGHHGTEGNYYDVWAVKLNSTGAITWQKCFGGNYDDTGSDIIVTNDGGYLFTSKTFSTNGDLSFSFILSSVYSNAWLAKLNSSGVLQWEKAYGGSNNDTGVVTYQEADGTFTLVGSSSSNDYDLTNANGHGGNDYWITKLTADPVLSIDSNEYLNVTLYPNPTSSILNIKTDNIIIDEVVVTDLQGKTVLQQSADCSQLNVQSLTTGIYVLKAVTNDKVVIQKFMKQ